MKDNKFNFKCRKCGLCCCGFSEKKGIVLFQEDINKISEKLNLKQEEFVMRYCYSKKIGTDRKILTIYILRYVNNHCIFLNKNNLCDIHEFKPLQCKKGPLFIYWGVERWNNCKSMKNVKLPENWSTDEEDYKLISSFFNEQS